MRGGHAALLAACLLPVFQAAAGEQGAAVFKRNCAVCHSVEEGKNRMGPSLAGVIDRKAGSVPNFNYSSANATSGIVWSKAELNAYLADPQAVVPGTAMMFPGLKSADDRQALIDFLAEN